MPELNGWVGLCLTVMVLLVIATYLYETTPPADPTDKDTDR